MKKHWSRDAHEARFSQPFIDNIERLAAYLEESVTLVAGADTVRLTDELIDLCRTGAQARDYSNAQDRMRAVDDQQILWMLRTLVCWFQLMNAAEKCEVARINRARMSADESGAPPHDSLECTVAQLKNGGASLGTLERLLGRLDIQPTFTAHPTETQRRTTRLKLRRVERLLETAQRSDRTMLEEMTALDDLRNEVATLLCTEATRPERPDVETEADNIVGILCGPVWEGVPRLYRSLQQAVRRHFDADIEVPAFLRFRSWAGGDRDGNPNVTPETTRKTLALHRRIAIEGHIGELEALAQELSISSTRVATPQQVSVDRMDEPYRLKIGAMMDRLRDALTEEDATRGDAYAAADYVRDLTSIGQSLEANRLGRVARLGRLQRTMWLARSFGFHLAALDVRQNSAVHEETVHMLLRSRDVDYKALSEPARRRVLHAAISDPKPLTLPRHGPGAPETLRLLDVLRDALARDRSAVGAYVISAAHDVSDVLEVMFLARAGGLWSSIDERAMPLDVVPLFETISDLEAIEERLNDLFDDPIYGPHVAARGIQEVMIGYSDNNKDGGYWMANWALHQAQRAIARVGRSRGMPMRVFHGRGGSLERGGALESEAMLVSAGGTHSGRLRFTEQGEVASFHYGTAAAAARHLERIAHTVIEATAREERAGSADALEVFGALAERSMRAYRNLIDAPEFWPWFLDATPVREIGRLPIASRPAARGGDLTFDGLRAIPWVFSWRQARYAVPGWFGIGTTMRDTDLGMEDLRALHDGNDFFSLIIDGALREVARARLDIAARYAALGGPEAEAIHRTIAQDLSMTQNVLLHVSGRQAPLDRHDTLRKLIDFRNPTIDVLHLIQIELLRRCREAPSRRRQDTEPSLILSIAGLAAAIESTG